MKTDTKETISFVLASLGMVFFSVVLFTVGKMSVAIKEVTQGFYGTELKRNHNSVELRVIGSKVKDCKFLAGGEIPAVHDGHEWLIRNVNFTFLGRAQGNRPVGEHDFGIWRWEFSAMNSVKSVSLTVHHNCNGALISTTIDPFNL